MSFLIEETAAFRLPAFPKPGCSHSRPSDLQLIRHRVCSARFCVLVYILLLVVHVDTSGQLTDLETAGTVQSHKHTHCLGAPSNAVSPMGQHVKFAVRFIALFSDWRLEVVRARKLNRTSWHCQHVPANRINSLHSTSSTVSNQPCQTVSIHACRHWCGLAFRMVVFIKRGWRRITRGQGMSAWQLAQRACGSYRLYRCREQGTEFTRINSLCT